MTLSNSDLFLINRGGTDYSVSFDKVMADIDGLINITDAEITIIESDGTVVGKFSVNQTGDTTITLPQVVIPESLHPKGFINVANPAPADPEHGDIYIQSTGGAGDVTADASFAPGITGTVEEGVFVIFGVDDLWHAGGQSNPTTVQTDWNETDVTSDAFLKNKPDLSKEVNDLAGDGAINVNAGAGLIATGQNATANQKTGTTRTIAAVVGDGITIDGSGGISIDPSFNLDGNVTAPNDGTLTINNADGTVAGTFTADQAGDTTVTLPKGFTGDYNDLNNKPVIGDGELKIQDTDGVLLTTFTANQIDDDVLTLPKGFSGDYNDLVNKPEINDGSMTLESESGTVYGSFSANEASNITISIPDPFSGDWADINNKPTEFPSASHTHTLEELTDTSINGESDGQVLTYDSAQKLWVNSDVPESGLPESDINNLIGQQKLDDHVDVTVPNPKQHDILAWDDRLQLWVAKSPLQPPSAISVKGVINVSQPAPQNPKAGDLYFHHDPNVSTGPDDVVLADPTWTGIVGQEVHEGEYVLYSTDNEWHHTGNDMIQLAELQADWDQVDPNEPDYIHNKPDIIQLIDDNAGDGEINVNAGNGIAATGANATANQKGNTTRTLSVKTSSGITIDGGGNVIIDPNYNLDGNITPPGNGEINVNAGAGLSVSGANATANQTGNTTRTFAVKTGGGIIIDGSGNVAIDPAFNLDGNITPPGNGQINVNAGNGLSVAGANATANQTATTTRTFTVKTGNGITIDAGGNVAIDPAYNLDGNVTAPNNGVLTINDHTGKSVGTFTANQAGPTTVALPKGFSGDYNDLANKPAINNGTLTVKNSDGSTAGSFTANQAGATNLTLPKGFSGEWNDLNGKPTQFPPTSHGHAWGEISGKPACYAPCAHRHPWSELDNVPTQFPPSSHSHSYNDLTDKPAINNGTLTIKDSSGANVGTFTANQAGATNVTLPKGFSGAYGDLSGIPSEFPPASHTHNYLPTDINQYQLLSA